MTTASRESHAFKAETKKLLDLMINSLYTEKEIFLRELISNASDACDRLRFEALTRPELLGDDELQIRLEADPEARTLTVRDNGIGMSRQEVIDNVGTIARSGSRELMERLQREGTPEGVAELIGQFGVGFYSAFMVSDEVEILTRRAGEEEATRWRSTGDGTYELEPAERDGRGTTITLHLKSADAGAGIEDYTDRYVVSRIVKRYSDFVIYPILWKDRREEPEQDAGGKPIEGKTRTVTEDVVLNSQRPVWTRPEDEVTEEDYAEFYKHVSHDWNEPLERLRLKAEGRIEYQALLFIPKEAPFDLYYYAYDYGLQLYVRRVMIMDRCAELLPRYLRFVKGVVESDDLPLNISRQRLQEDRHILQIRRWLTRKVLERLRLVKEQDEDKYLAFWRHFGKALKEGLASDFDNKDALLELVLFPSSHDPEKLTTLDGYAARMKSDQEEIYYLTGESREVVESSPHLEAFRDRGYEVLYLVDPVDELVVQHLMEHRGKRLKSVEKTTVKPGGKEEKEKIEASLKEKEEQVKDLLEVFEKRLEAHVKQVRLSARLTTSPACLVGADHDYSPQLEKLLHKGQGGGPKQRRILELNPEHDVFRRLEERFAADPEDPLLGDYAELLMGYALLAEGSEPVDRVRFNRLLAGVLTERLGN
ncbi:MAG: molecular chaperone HtpG [Acidobacteria bacterium]|nr:MAG: molecular chaperone HtpG [Acidobacteriota bacterium]